MPQGGRYLLFQKAEAALLEEKAAKLFGITRILDNYLEETYLDLLRKNLKGPLPETREEKIKALNQLLAPFTDLIAASFPGVGVGYYSRELEAILTYGPSKEFGDRVGVTVAPEHLGRQAMAQQREIVGVGSMVRGEIMNCMRPLIRDNEAIGFVWANETLEDIYRQIEQGTRKLFFSPQLEPVLGLTGLLLLSARLLILARSLEVQLSYKLFPWTVNYMRHYLNLFLNTLKLGIIIADAEDRVVFSNQALWETLELQPEAFPVEENQSCRLLLAEMGLAELNAIDEQLRANHEKQYFSKFTVSLPGERKKELNLTLAYLEEVPGPPENMVGKIFIFEDLEQAQEEEKKQARTDKLATLGELAASIAHELRNPLTIVLGSLQLLPQRMENRGFLYSFLRIATQELVRVNNTVEALLDFARFSQPEFTLVDVNTVLAHILRLFKVAFENQGVAVERNLSPSLPLITADEKQLRQAFLNLVLNALQAMPGGGKLKIATYYHEGDKFLQVTISDTGAGIKPEIQPYIFDAFYSTKERGTGLGLALVHRVIDEHEGIIEFESEENRGTTFYLHLPVRQSRGPEGKVTYWKDEVVL